VTPSTVTHKIPSEDYAASQNQSASPDILSVKSNRKAPGRTVFQRAPEQVSEPGFIKRLEQLTGLSGDQSYIAKSVATLEELNMADDGAEQSIPDMSVGADTGYKQSESSINAPSPTSAAEDQQMSDALEIGTSPDLECANPQGLQDMHNKVPLLQAIPPVDRTDVSPPDQRNGSHLQAKTPSLAASPRAASEPLPPGDMDVDMNVSQAQTLGSLLSRVTDPKVDRQTIEQIESPKPHTPYADAEGITPMQGLNMQREQTQGASTPLETPGSTPKLGNGTLASASQTDIRDDIHESEDSMKNISKATTSQKILVPDSKAGAVGTQNGSAGADNSALASQTMFQPPTATSRPRTVDLFTGNDTIEGGLAATLRIVNFPDLDPGTSAELGKRTVPTEPFMVNGRTNRQPDPSKCYDSRGVVEVLKFCYTKNDLNKKISNLSDFRLNFSTKRDAIANPPSGRPAWIEVNGLKYFLAYAGKHSQFRKMTRYFH
jgi:hypothetical protein